MDGKESRTGVRIPRCPWEPGDIVVVPYDDLPDNQEILNLPVKVAKKSQAHSPFWTVVEYEGREYSVRGSELRPFRKG